jgi:hypothetical protein
MIPGLLYKAMHKCELAVRPLTEGKLIMPQFGQSPMLAKIESALAGLAEAYARLRLSPQAPVSDGCEWTDSPTATTDREWVTRHGFGSAANVRIPPNYDVHPRSAMSALRRFETSLKRLKCANSGHSRWCEPALTRGGDPLSHSKATDEDLYCLASRTGHLTRIPGACARGRPKRSAAGIPGRSPAPWSRPRTQRSETSPHRPQRARLPAPAR